MLLSEGTGVQAVPSYEQNLHDIESYISGLDAKCANFGFLTA